VQPEQYIAFQGSKSCKTPSISQEWRHESLFETQQHYTPVSGRLAANLATHLRVTHRSTTAWQAHTASAYHNQKWKSE